MVNEYEIDNKCSDKTKNLPIFFISQRLYGANNLFSNAKKTFNFL